MIDIQEEYQLTEERMHKFLLLLDIYFEIIKGNVKHPRAKEWASLLIEIVYSYFYSVIDDRDDSINVFRIWKKKYPDHLEEISRIEVEIEPYKAFFMKLRHNVGFHGSTSQKGNKVGMQLFKNVDGKVALELMLAVRNLSTHLISVHKKIDRKLPPYQCVVCNKV